jgi:non-heme chloroperoxidase
MNIDCKIVGLTLTLAMVTMTVFSHSALAQTTNAPAKPADKSPHTSGFVTANGIKQHYLDWGGKGDVLLLLAGLGNDAHVYDDFAPKFTDRYHVIGLTRRGFGESDKPNTGYDIVTRIEDVRRFLDALEIKKVSIVGHSMAGDELTLFATRYPQRVRKLVYLDAAYDRSGFMQLGLANPGITPFWKRLTLEALGSPEAAKISVDEKEMPPPAVWETYVAIVKAMNAFRPDYTRVNAPALAFYALSEHNPDITSKTDEAIRRKCDEWWIKSFLPLVRRSIEHFGREAPHGQIVELKDATHYVFAGKTADQVVRQTREFLPRPSP